MRSILKYVVYSQDGNALLVTHLCLVSLCFSNALPVTGTKLGLDQGDVVLCHMMVSMDAGGGHTHGKESHLGYVLGRRYKVRTAYTKGGSGAAREAGLQENLMCRLPQEGHIHAPGIGDRAGRQRPLRGPRVP